jgi:hypothetical protein
MVAHKTEPKQLPWPKRADSTLYARRHCSRSLLSLLSVHMCICLMYLRLRGVSLWVARAGQPAFPISVRAFHYPCRARVRVPCWLLYRWGNNTYRIHDHIICMITAPPCALATCWLRTCHPSPDSCALAFWQEEHHVRCCSFINDNHVVAHTFTQC